MHHNDCMTFDHTHTLTIFLASFLDENAACFDYSTRQTDRQTDREADRKTELANLIIIKLDHFAPSFLQPGPSLPLQWEQHAGQGLDELLAMGHGDELGEGAVDTLQELDEQLHRLLTQGGGFREVGGLCMCVSTQYVSKQVQCTYEQVRTM